MIALNGQISSTTADYSDTTNYRLDGVNDKIFVFYSPGGSKSGSLRADGPVAGNFDFSWSRFDTINKIWNSFLNENDIGFSEVMDLSEGGYKVDITNEAGVDTSFRAWVHLNDFSVELLSDDEDKVRFVKINCGSIRLNATVNIDSFYYYDLNSNKRILQNPKLNYLWTSDNSEHSIASPSVGYESKTIGNPPFQDTWFIFTAIDYSGMEDVDSVFYESIEVKSEYSFEFFDKKEAKDFIDPSSNSDDAPLKVRFTNLSINGYEFEWIYADTIGTFGSEIFANYETSDVNEQTEFTYLIPDDYYPALVAQSFEGCVDTFRLAEPIKVVPSELEAPNVFSPEGNTSHFKVSFKSIKEFHIRIFSRTGKLVYRADVKDMYSWEGWNGNVLDSDRKAPPGIYYYVIEATGWDEIRYNDGIYKGFVYLFRPKN